MEEKDTLIHLGEDDWRVYVTKELQNFAAEAKEIREKIDDNTKLTKEIKEIFEALQGAFTVLGWIAKFIKWVSGIAIAAGAVITAWRTIRPGE